MPNTPWAKTILRSRHSQRPDKVLSTLLVRMPRSILAEFNTHRVFSRNAASSRAIPIEKLIKQVLDDPFIPLHWGKNQKGMQASEAFNEHDQGLLIAAWLSARDNAVAAAQGMLAFGVHKQIVNRLLEPWMWTIVCVSATEWSNFRALREHKDAEPHIQILAKEVGRELDREDNIQTLKPGQWHLPFIDWIKDLDEAKYTTLQSTQLTQQELMLEILIKKAVACCASTSYKTVDGFDMTLDRAIELHDRLVGSSPLHASPAEHVAQADEIVEERVYDNDGHWIGDSNNVWDNPEQHGNFTGFRQYRKMLKNECL